MTQRRKWTAIPGLLALAAAAVVLSAYSGASSSQNRQPVQPINFPHTVHVEKLGINCLYCHYTANKSPDPGLPAVSTCMGCHTLIGPDRPKSDLGDKRRSPELEKLVKYWNNGAGKPIPWERIHKLPDYVHFPHMRHVNAGVTCQTCHGQIQKMARVYQFASLNMGWCVTCHVNGYSPQQGLEAAGYAAAPVAQSGTPAASDSSARKTARYDCANCHY
jgi:Cytochrome c7 and related cytochrome c